MHLVPGWGNPFLTRRRPVLADQMVVASQPLAAQAGLHMLAKGGNAIDAAVAGAAVLAVVEPTNNGVGGDAFALVWHEGRLHGINGSGPAPRAWTPEHFAGQQSVPLRGWQSVTIPGAVAAWSALGARFGRLPLEIVLEPAIRYARTGFPVSPGVAEKWAQQAGRLASEPGFAQAFLPEGRTPLPGERFTPQGLAETLERIASSAGRDFYEGETARRIVAFAQETGGRIDAADLAAQSVGWDSPLQIDYRGLTVHEMPPNSQGLVALMALGILSALQMPDFVPDSAPAIHLQIEALKLAFADARRHLGDPRTMRVECSRLLAPDYLASRARLIDRQRAQDFGPGMPALAGTVYLAAADASGSVVSLIQSNYMGFGSGVVVPGTGVAFHNRGACFTLEPGHPNQVAPGKRPYHTILPGMLSRDGRPVAALGSTGGTYQPQGHVHIVLRLAHAAHSPQAIVDAPRFRVDAGLKVSFEPGFDAAVLAELATLGHEVKAQLESSWDFGGMQMLLRTGDTWLGASDARRDSQAAGF